MKKESMRGKSLPVQNYIPVEKVKKRRLAVDENGDEFELDDLENLEDLEDNQKLDEFRNLFGDRQYVMRIERLNEQTNEMELCEKVFLQSFDPLLVGTKYGGGKFIASLFNEGGKYVRGGRMRFTVAKPLIQESPKAADPMQNPMLQMVLEQMKSEKALLASLIEKMVTKDAPAPQPMSELLTALKSLQDLSPKDKEKNPMKELMEMMTLQKQMKELMGEDDRGPGFMGELAEAMKLLPQLKNLQPVPRPGAPPVGVKPMGLPVVSAPPKEEPPMPTFERKLNFYLPAFTEAANAQSDVDKWASWLVTVLDNEIVPAIVEKYHGMIDAEGVWDRLIEAANDPEKVEKVFQHAPGLEPHRTWVLNVIQKAVGEMTEEAAAPVNGHGTDGE